MFGRVLLVLGLLFVFTTQVDAQIFRFRRGGCSSGSCGSSGYSNAAIGGGCSSGNCAVPALARQVKESDTQTAERQDQRVEQPVFVATAVPQVVATQSSVDWSLATDRAVKKSLTSSSDNPLLRAYRASVRDDQTEVPRVQLARSLR